MNCTRAQRRLSLRRDGRLPPGPARRLERHLAACPACRDFAAQLDAMAAQLRARPAPAGPTPEVAWADVRRAIRLAAAPEPRGLAALWAAGPGLRWASAAALFVAVTAGGLMWSEATHGHAPAAGTAEPTTEVLQVSSGLADASTMVYEDRVTGWTVVWVLPPENGNHARL